MTHRPTRRRQIEPVLKVCSILDLDPELGNGLEGEELALARRLCRAQPLSIPAGRWELQPHADLVGYLLIDGIVCRELSLMDRRSLELLGAGDIVSPLIAPGWPQLGGGGCIVAITDSLAVALDATFTRTAARWPLVLAAVHRRLEAQRERLAVQGLIAHLPRAEHRLLLALWHLAGRWGRVTPQGIAIPLQLTHDLLGQLIAARRPTVTLAVKRGEQEGWLVRREDGCWLLTERAEQMARSLARPRSARSNGETLMLRQRTAEVLSNARALRASVHQDRAAAAEHRANRSSPGAGSVIR